MPGALQFFFHYLWLIFVVFMCINVLYLTFRLQLQIRQRPELAACYRQLYRAYLLFNLPYIVMGIGLKFGGVPSIFSYFRPRDGNPFVLAFWFVVFALWILGFWWFFFARGAEIMAEHHGSRRGFPRSPTQFRVWFCLSLLGGIVGACFMWFADIPVPVFHQ